MPIRDVHLPPESGHKAVRVDVCWVRRQTSLHSMHLVPCGERRFTQSPDQEPFPPESNHKAAATPKNVASEMALDCRKSCEPRSPRARRWTPPATRGCVALACALERDIVFTAQVKTGGAQPCHVTSKAAVRVSSSWGLKKGAYCWKGASNTPTRRSRTPASV